MLIERARFILNLEEGKKDKLEVLHSRTDRLCSPAGPGAMKSKKMGYPRMQILVLVSMLPVALLLSACGDDAETAKKTYNRGYEDGEIAVCNQIYKFNPAMFKTLERQRIC